MVSCCHGSYHWKQSYKLYATEPKWIVTRRRDIYSCIFCVVLTTCIACDEYSEKEGCARNVQTNGFNFMAVRQYLSYWTSRLQSIELSLYTDVANISGTSSLGGFLVYWTCRIIEVLTNSIRVLVQFYMSAFRGVGSLCGDKALEGQAIVCAQWFAPPMLCLLRTFRRFCQRLSL